MRGTQTTFQAVRGTDVRATRGTKSRNKDKLKSDRDRTMSAKPGAHRDEFGSEHNVDDRKTAQRRKGRQGGRQNLNQRERPQDVREETHPRNKEAGRRRPKVGGPTNTLNAPSTRKRR